MTAEEIIERAWFIQGKLNPYGRCSVYEALIAVRLAIAEEREACAKVAEGTLAPESNCAPSTPGYERRAVAAAIRART